MCLILLLTKSLLILPHFTDRLSPADLLRGKPTNQTIGKGDGKSCGFCLTLALQLCFRGCLKLLSEFNKICIEFLNYS